MANLPRKLKAAISDPELASDAELYILSEHLSREAFSAHDAAYGTYVTSALGVPKLHASLLATYRKNLIEWMNYALVKRANLGGGGAGIKKVETGLAAFVKAIPAIVTEGANPKLSNYLPDTEYFVANRLDPIGAKILQTVKTDAAAAGMLGTPHLASRVRFKVKWDDRGKLWYIPFDNRTYDAYAQLAMDGFKANRGARRWERKKPLTPGLYETYDVEGGPPPAPVEAPAAPARPKPEERELARAPETLPATPFTDWYFTTWLPANIERFTKVFTNYARSAQSSYEIRFSLSGREPKVKFQRNISTPVEAIEELRYRYLDRHGREPWLEVLDKFAELISHTTPDQRLLGIIDRINNLQHSNGLFMEHFPKDVYEWYIKFLNAKYHTPQVDELAKFIKDSDLRTLLIEVGRRSLGRSVPRLPGFAESPAPEQYQHMEKDLPPPEVNWRERGYPKYKGAPDVRREDRRVQDGLAELRQMSEYRPLLESADVEVLTRLPDLLPEVAKLKGSPNQFRNIPLHWHGVYVERRGLLTDADIEPYTKRLEALARETETLIDQAPSLPLDVAQLETYTEWVKALRAKGEEAERIRAEFDASVADKVQEQDKQLEERRREQEMYWRETYMDPTEAARWMRARLITRVAYRYLLKKAAKTA